MQKYYTRALPVHDLPWQRSPHQNFLNSLTDKFNHTNASSSVQARMWKVRNMTTIHLAILLNIFQMGHKRTTLKAFFNPGLRETEYYQHC
jgi:hypothetical protein